MDKIFPQFNHQYTSGEIPLKPENYSGILPEEL